MWQWIVGCECFLKPSCSAWGHSMWNIEIKTIELTLSQKAETSLAEFSPWKHHQEIQKWQSLKMFYILVSYIKPYLSWIWCARDQQLCHQEEPRVKKWAEQGDALISTGTWGHNGVPCPGQPVRLQKETLIKMLCMHDGMMQDKIPNSQTLPLCFLKLHGTQ